MERFLKVRAAWTNWDKSLPATLTEAEVRYLAENEWAQHRRRMYCGGEARSAAWRPERVAALERLMTSNEIEFPSIIAGVFSCRLALIAI
jgi:hypothetical protein